MILYILLAVCTTETDVNVEAEAFKEPAKCIQKAEKFEKDYQDKCLNLKAVCKEKVLN